MKNSIKIVLILVFVIISISTVQAGWFDSWFGNDEKKVSEEQKLPDKWELKDINLEMVKCPAGSFMMGDNKKDPVYSLSLDRPHKVTLTKPFYIGKYEVIQSQYEKIMGKNPSKFKSPNNPVERVYWFEARDFCEKLNMKYKSSLPKGYIFDLPTEAQWEYACRAGTTTDLNNGKNLTTEDGSCPNLDEVAWYNKNSEKTHPVGQKKPNAWGIYDMHGNVEEWCRDMYCEDFYSLRKEYIDPYNIYGSRRVRRGGCWFNRALFCRSARRNSLSPDDRDYDLGFRVALVPIE